MSAEALACGRCGVLDPTVRLAAYSFVFSIIVLSFKRGRAGIFCARCRRAVAIECSLVTVLAGWWGIPWGIFWSLQALITNARGGVVPRVENAALLAAVAQRLAERGEQFASADAWSASRPLAPEGVPTATANSLRGGSAPSAAAPKRGRSRRATGAAVACLVVGLVAGGALVYLALSDKPAYAAPPAPYTVTTEDFTFNVPGGWYAVRVQPDAIDASLADLGTRYGANGMDGLRDRARAGAKFMAVYVGPDARVDGGHLPLLTVTMDTYRGAGGVRAVLDGMQATLARDTRFRPLVKTSVMGANGPMGMLFYEPAPPLAGPQVRNYIFYRDSSGTIYFLRFETDEVLQDRMSAHYTTMLRSFQPAK